MIADGKRRILVEANEPSMVPDLLSSLKEEIPAMSAVIYDDPSEFASAALAGHTFSDEPRLVVLWDLGSEMPEPIAQLLDAETQDVIMVIQRKAPPRSRAYTRMRSEWEVLTLEPLDEKSCQAYVTSMLKKMGVSFDQDVPAIIVERRGRDLPALKTEVRKLRMLGRSVDRETCMKLVRPPHDIKIFDFVDAILRRRWMQACTIAASSHEEDLGHLLHMLQLQCVKLYKAAVLKDQGMGFEDIATMLELPPYIVKTKILPLASQMGKGGALKMLDAVHAADETARVSKLPKHTLLEALVVKLLRS